MDRLPEERVTFWKGSHMAWAGFKASGEGVALFSCDFCVTPGRPWSRACVKNGARPCGMWWLAKVSRVAGERTGTPLDINRQRIVVVKK